MKRYFLILIALCFFRSADAQSNWKSRGPLFEDKYITVEIEYAMGNDPCRAEDAASYYRYKITRLTMKRKLYINWRFDYFNCDHELKTHVNSLHLTEATKLGYITPQDNRFIALKLVNNFNDVRLSSRLPEATDYKPVSSISLEPLSIIGKLNIRKGTETTLSFRGGYLAGTSTWKWYAGSCDGVSIGEGANITVRPEHTTVYALRGEGQHPTSCIFSTVIVSDESLAASLIAGKTRVCDGEAGVELKVVGGALGSGAKWVWYQDNCGGSMIGEGERITVTPTRNTTYYVRAEGPSGNTACRQHDITVETKSIPPEGIDGPDKVATGQSFILSVRGGQLNGTSHWIWYSEQAGDRQKLGEGPAINISSFSEDRTISVRAEGPCDQSAFLFKTIHFTRKPKPDQSAAGKPKGTMSFFVNGGLVANDPNKLSGIRNYVATLGGGKNIGWFIRAKIAGAKENAAFHSEDARVSDYNNPGYYQYNGRTISKRRGYTGGIYLGGRYFAVYAGAGYGTREFLYGINQYSYSDAYASQTGWVKNSTYSYEGAEIEGGLILRAGFVNLMGGIATIRGKYQDYNIGIGFNL